MKLLTLREAVSNDEVYVNPESVTIIASHRYFDPVACEYLIGSVIKTIRHEVYVTRSADIVRDLILQATNG